MRFGPSRNLACWTLAAVTLGWLLSSSASAVLTAEQAEKLLAATRALTKAETLYKAGKLTEAAAAYPLAQKALVDLAPTKALAKSLVPLRKRLIDLHDNMAIDGAKVPGVAAVLAFSPTSGSVAAADFEPSPDHPIGWRGDGTGCFPNATPPLEWYRRPKGAFNSIRVEAARPKGNAPDGQPLNMGSIQDWLVAGPFDAKDHATALDDVVESNEARLQPAAGESLAGKPWKPATISVTNQSSSWSRLALDLTVLYGTQGKQDWQNKPGGGRLPPQVSYACTNLYSAEPGNVMLRIEDADVRAWLNGNPIKIPENQYVPGPTVTLVRGWNRLTIKTASTKDNWNISALVSPMPGSGYETKNIVWMTPMPGPSWSSPIVVGSKVFVNADEGTLVCVNKADGQVLWTRSLTYYHAIPESERSQFPELAAKAQQLDQLMLALPAELNACVSTDGSNADGNKALEAKIKQKRDLERTIQETMGKENRTYRSWANNRGTTTPTPISDGRYVYVAYYGGDKGIGANVVACFDLDGKNIWRQFTGQTNIGEHGQHATPALSGNLLVYLSGAKLFGYDKTTGQVLWEKKLNKEGMMSGASLVALRAGADDAVLVPEFGLYRTADGAELWKSDAVNSIVTPTLVDGTVYGLGGRPEVFYAFGIPASFGDAWKPQYLYKRPWRDIGLAFPDLGAFNGGSSGSFNNGIIGSVLCHDGLVYAVSEGGGLTVVEAGTSKTVYTHPLESLNPRLTWVFKVGICTGPTLAGKYIHIRDDQSQTLVIAPGREYKELAKNVLWELQADGRQQEAQSNPFYEGSRIYYRTQGFLYCIGEE